MSTGLSRKSVYDRVDDHLGRYLYQPGLVDGRPAYRVHFVPDPAPLHYWTGSVFTGFQDSMSTWHFYHRATAVRRSPEIERITGCSQAGLFPVASPVLSVWGRLPGKG